MTKIIPIPQPKPKPFIGNVSDIDTKNPVQSLMELQKEYGAIFKFNRPNSFMYVVSSQELVHEICDETRFGKKVHEALENIRGFAGDGLFTAKTDEPNWGPAHRILMPAFGPAALKDLFPPMLDIAEQMLIKWERLGSNEVLDVVENMTRLTLDTIALCAFDFRFNSFYQKEVHPFIDAMVRSLDEMGARTRRLKIQSRLMLMKERKLALDTKYMHDLADSFIKQRKQDPEREQKKDLLNKMLMGVDPVTKQKLSDENIRFQLVTFLIAGHETTSGLISFAINALVKHPHVLAKARAEADSAFCGETPRFEHMARLTYIDQVLKETMRMWPSAPAFAVSPFEDTVIGGKYQVKKGDTLLVLVPSLHRDPSAWQNPDVFDPERFSPENIENIPENAWKPFGNGMRACIGRPFAMQEAALVLAMTLTRFDLFETDPNYQLIIKETLTFKPEGLFLRAKKRKKLDPENKVKDIQSAITNSKIQEPFKFSEEIQKFSSQKSSAPFYVLYGSNSGSCETFAQKIALEAKVQGFNVHYSSLDECVAQIAPLSTVVIVTSSYEGQPPENAKNFVAWLETLKEKSLENIKFVVYGCGNRDWARTYQAIPIKVENLLLKAGGIKLMERGASDARGDFFGDFEKWHEKMWPLISQSLGVELKEVESRPLYCVENVISSSQNLLHINGLSVGRILVNRELVNMNSPLGRSKRHIEIALPEGQTYQSGDYLNVLPENPRQQVQKVLTHFGYHWDSLIQLKKIDEADSFMPTNKPIYLSEILSRYVELAQPATQKQIKMLETRATSLEEQSLLSKYANDNELYLKEVLEKRVSVIDLLEKYSSCSLPLSLFLEMLPQLRPRQYSISSSPSWNAQKCSLTVAVLDAPAWSGQGKYLGTASNYLASKKEGSLVSVTVRPSKGEFHLPKNATRPMIMIGAGTGLAPLRGFLQELSIRAEKGEKIGKTLLYFGCEHPEVDFLYKEELHSWESKGVVFLRPTFSSSSKDEIKYVQHRILAESNEIFSLLEQDAIIYICGDGRRMAPSVKEAMIQVYQKHKGISEHLAKNWMEEMEKNHRYLADVFG